MEIFDLMGLVVICALSYFTLCRLFDVDKLTSDQLDRYNKELEHQRWVLECNAVPSNHNYEYMAEQAVMSGKSQEDNPFPRGTRDHDRWLCAYWDYAYRMGDNVATNPKAEVLLPECKDRRYFEWATSGCVFPTPGGDVIRIELPDDKVTACCYSQN